MYKTLLNNSMSSRFLFLLVIKIVVYLVPGVLYIGFLLHFGPVEGDAFENSSNGDFLKVAIGATFLFWGLSWLYQYTLGKVLALVVLLLLSLNLTISFSSWYYYDSPFGSIAALTLLDGNQQAAAEFLVEHWLLLAFFITFIALNAIIIRVISRQTKTNAGRISFFLALGWFGLGLYADLTVNREYDNTGVFKHIDLADFLSKTPLYNASHLFYAYDSKAFVIETMKQKHEFPNVVANKEIDVHVVVIGEAGRRDRHSLYGYERKTTPYIDAIENELLIFKQANAPSTQSVISAATSLSEVSVTEIGPKTLSKNIVALAQQAGYRTSWISVPGLGFGRYNNFISAIGRQAQVQVDLMDQLDTAVIPAIEDQLEYLGPQVIFVHLLGSHPIFNQRYPAEFAKFKGGNAEEYDNTILFDDFMLNEVINRLRGKNATLTYFTDHGLVWDESEQRFRHGGANPPASVFDVPFWVWYSDQAKLSRPGLDVHIDKAFNLEDLYFFLVTNLGVNYSGLETCKSPIERCYEAKETVVRALDGVPVRLADLR